jgi:hypothetical protein
MRLPQETIERWRKWCALELANRKMTCADIKTGRDAWAAASLCGILRDAYSDNAIKDAHIQTALEKIFPEAEFKDAKRY